MTLVKKFSFIEGRSYEFYLKSVNRFEDDHSAFYILESQVGTKHLMTYADYKDYGLITGQKITCRIDKISCSGRIYLEPAHRFYREGKKYHFNNAGTFEKTLANGTKLTFLKLIGVNNVHTVINITDHPHETFGKNVICIVNRIKKGRLYVSLYDERILSKLKRGETYNFKMIRSVFLTEDEEYFELQDEFGTLHYLKKKYYKDYNINQQIPLRCKVINKVFKFNHYLEPEHPIYKIGETYEFIIIGKETLTNVYNQEIVNAIVEDCYGKEHFVIWKKIKEPVPVGQRIHCKVLDLKMSKLRLKLIETPD